VSTLEYHFNLIQEKQNLLDVALFSDAYCIESEDYWENFERRVSRSLSTFTTEEMLSLFTSFANQREGSETLHNKFEKHFEEELGALRLKQLC